MNTFQIHYQVYLLCFPSNMYYHLHQVARKFCEAVKAGKSEIVKPYFYEKASFFGQLNETTYQSGSIEEFYTTIDTFGACGDDYIAILISIYRQKANELNIPIITEAQFLSMIGE